MPSSTPPDSLRGPRRWPTRSPDQYEARGSPDWRDIAGGNSKFTEISRTRRDSDALKAADAHQIRVGSQAAAEGLSIRADDPEAATGIAMRSEVLGLSDEHVDELVAIAVHSLIAGLTESAGFMGIAWPTKRQNYGGGGGESWMSRVHSACIAAAAIRNRPASAWPSTASSAMLGPALLRHDYQETEELKQAFLPKAPLG